MAKSKAERLKAALEKGDMDLAKKLTDEIVAAAAKKAPRKPTKRVAATGGSRVRTKPVKPVDEPLEGSTTPLILLSGDTTATPRHNGIHGQDGQGIAPSRSEKNYGRRESMQGREHHNKFDEWMKSQGSNIDGLDSRLKKVDKKITQSNPITPRPGMPGARRSIATKVRTVCDGCGKPFDVYPSELRILDSESVYKCDRCISRGK